MTDSRYGTKSEVDLYDAEIRERIRILDQNDQEVVIYKPSRKKKDGKPSSKSKKHRSGRSKSRTRMEGDGLEKGSTSSSGSKKRRGRSRMTGDGLHRDTFIEVPQGDGGPFEIGNLAENTAPTPAYDDIEQASAPRNIYSMDDVEKPKKDTKGNTNSKSHLNHRLDAMWKELLRYKTLKFFQVALTIYVAVLTFADIGPPGGLRDTETGLIVDSTSTQRTEAGLILVNGTERAIIAASMFQVVCIGIARLSAWFMYPALVFVFISKFRATATFLSKTPISMYMYKDSHELHVYCGWTIFICATIHSIAHLARWAAQGNLSLLISHFSGVTGLIIITSCLLICIPMTLCRTQIKYEIRKNLHFLFIAFAGALVFHTPTSAIPNGGFTAYVFGTLLAWYFLDATYCYFFMTEKIDTTNFAVVPSGVRMTMNVSKRFQKVGTQGGICYVCLPWVAKDQWHAFSLFENPTNPAERQIFIQKTGDWTTKLHQILQRDTVRPCWVHGPFPSPYNNAESYDNQVLVASGIGITPALSVIRAHKDSRRISLIWAVRDEHLLKFFLRHLYLDHRGWNLIFYTGKNKLNDSIMEIVKDTNICIIQGRPRLDEVIPNIIYGVESGQGLPERYSPDTRAGASEVLTDRLMAAGSTSSSNNETLAVDLACLASELGYNLPPEQLSRNMSLLKAAARSGREEASKAINNQLAIGFRPWDYHEGSQTYVHNLDEKLVMKTWGMLYCGGAKPVQDALEKISEEYNVGLHTESFAW